MHQYRNDSLSSNVGHICLHYRQVQKVTSQSFGWNRGGTHGGTGRRVSTFPQQRHGWCIYLPFPRRVEKIIESTEIFCNPLYAYVCPNKLEGYKMISPLPSTLHPSSFLPNLHSKHDLLPRHPPISANTEVEFDEKHGWAWSNQFSLSDSGIPSTSSEHKAEISSLLTSEIKCRCIHYKL